MIKINFSKIFNNEIDAQFQTESNFLIGQDIATPNQTHSSNVKFVTQPGYYDNNCLLYTSQSPRD